MAEKKEKRYLSDDLELLAEWHWEKNAPQTPYQVAYGSNKKVWWHCLTCGNDFETQVVNRTGYKHVGCNVCNKYLHTSFPEQAVFYYVRKLFPLAENKYTSFFDNQMELDIFIPELNIGIEYDGNYWHSETAHERNIKKHAICRQNGICLIRVKENYKRFPICTDDCDYSIYRESETDQGLCNAIADVLQILDCSKECDINISRDRSIIKSQYIISFKERSLLSKYPQLALEWHPTNNGFFKPDMVMPSSSDKVWWHCPKCGFDYPAAPSKRTRAKPTGCPVCANRIIIPGINDLATVRPDLAAEWHPFLNTDLKPTQIAPNYSKMVWWRCRLCGHEYQKTPNKRISSAQGCKECSRKIRAEKLHDKALKIGENDLASQYPEILEEWDYVANVGLPNPNEITVGNTSIKINWICSVCGYTWQATAYSRTHLKSGCQRCGWQKTGMARQKHALRKGINDLASQHPELLLDWDYENNANLFSPDEITVGNSKTKVHWICHVCGHRWKTYVYLRVHRGQGCRMCSRKNRK